MPGSSTTPGRSDLAMVLLHPSRTATHCDTAGPSAGLLLRQYTMLVNGGT
jgi:hypothetical protein